jgi:hypothetical protein
VRKRDKGDKKRLLIFRILSGGLLEPNAMKAAHPVLREA